MNEEYKEKSLSASHYLAMGGGGENPKSNSALNVRGTGPPIRAAFFTYLKLLHTCPSPVLTRNQFLENFRVTRGRAKRQHALYVRRKIHRTPRSIKDPYDQGTKHMPADDNTKSVT